MKKVIIVTSGEYSDYEIHGVFSTPELADKYTKIHPILYSEYHFEAWELDRIASPVQDDKYLYSVTAFSNSENVHVNEVYDDLSKRKEDEVYNYRDGTWSFITYVLAEDVLRARKIARDRFMQYKAEREGIS